MSDLSRSERVKAAREEHKDAVLKADETDDSSTPRYKRLKMKSSRLDKTVTNGVTIRDVAKDAKYFVSVSTSMSEDNGEYDKLLQLQEIINDFLSTIHESL